MTTTKEMIKKEGGSVSNTLSKNTTYLVAGDVPGSKYKKAEDLRVKIIGEEGFLRMIK